MFGLKRKLKGIVMGQIIAYILKLWAEGKFGAPLAAVYWWLAGKKTYIAAALGALYVALLKLGEASASGEVVCAPCVGYADYVLWFAGFLASIGFIDGALRTAAPKR